MGKLQAKPEHNGPAPVIGRCPHCRSPFTSKFARKTHACAGVAAEAASRPQMAEA